MTEVQKVFHFSERILHHFSAGDPSRAERVQTEGNESSRPKPLKHALLRHRKIPYSSPKSFLLQKVFSQMTRSICSLTEAFFLICCFHLNIFHCASQLFNKHKTTFHSSINKKGLASAKRHLFSQK